MTHTEIYICLVNWYVCSKLLMAGVNGSRPWALWDGNISVLGTPKIHL